MPTNYTGRIILILAVLLASLWAIFPSGNISRPDLKPGIDMVGGTSLLYEIQPPPGGSYNTNLAAEVASSLKKRVDPEGVRNLIWRPQGNTRLEIQMPLTRDSGDVAIRRQAYAAAQTALEQTNIRPHRVIAIVEDPSLTAEQRQQRLDDMAMGSAQRREIFSALSSTADQIRAAQAAGDADTQARLEIAYEADRDRIDPTNLSAAQLESILELSTEARSKRLGEIKAQYADFQRRLDAIDRLVGAFDQFAVVRGSLQDAADVKRLLKGSGVLEYYILAVPNSAAGYDNPTISAERYEQLARELLEKGPRLQAGSDTRWLQVDRPGELRGLTVTYNEKEWVLAYITPDKSMTRLEGAQQWALERAYPQQDQMGTSVVGFTFDPQGAALFSNLSGKNIGQYLAISLDEKIISAPRINSRIGRSGIIEGGSDGFTKDELTYLINTLNAGSLPARLADEPIMERTVGPQLGEDNLRRGLWACMFGVAVVAVFLIGYYYLSGVVAMIAVSLNLVIILGVMAMFNATFTLPSIAGIVLTIGMAVDANVLIFERLREEQLRGLSLRMALRNAYDRAWSAILDGNVTTGITAAALYMFGSEEVKGFGLTLLVGIVSSLFTALYVTRTVFGLLIDKGGVKSLSSLPLTFPRWDSLLRPNIDWMGKAWIAFTFSTIFIVGGMAAFGVQWYRGQLLDIEFASGTAVQFELTQPMRIEDVRSLINAESQKSPQDLPAPQVVSVGTGDLVYEVVTPQQQALPVRRAVLAAMGEKLKLERPSSFDGVGGPVEAAMDKLILPIEAAEQAVAGFIADELPEYVGGAAIILNNLNPPLPPADIEQRIERQRLQPQPGQTTPPYRPLTVVAETGRTTPATTAVVLVSDPLFPYDKDKAKWQSELARPMWQMVNEAVNNPPDLQKVVNFDAQVAGETQKEALMALILSVIAIMAYIWVRFGNLKYGTATVLAMLHDTVFVLAALGLTHLVAETIVGDALLLERFRINLTIVAAVLTVMGYSMNDTVVIFDRIRENRGKYGVVNPRVINDSVNQTLSRTLLTGGTTLLTILVMYITGGAGIHGFTFILLVGILVGTYSSIAIAAPVLLLGAGRTQESQDRKASSAGQLQRA
jgi:SecD/SecF fusion protein